MKPRERILHRIFKLRGWLILPPAAFTVFSTRGETEATWIIPAGLVLFLAGVLLRIWAQIHLHYRLKVHKILTMTGPYEYMRNPIYVGNACILVGLCVMSELVWFAPVALVWCALLYSVVVRYEEGRLTARYGEAYVEYTRLVPRWFPRRRRALAARPADVRGFIWPGVEAELHCLAFVVPFALKELLS